MALGRLGRVVAAFWLVAVPLVAAPVLAWADQAPPARVLSNFETSARGNHVNRDAGFSAVEPGTRNSLWLFGDSTWTGGHFWFGTTAAVGPSVSGLVPSRLTEIPTPRAAINAPSNRAPQGFLPAFPSGLKRPDGARCTGTGAIPASWPTGAAAEPAGGKMLITYIDVCETRTDTVERFNVAQYDPRRNALTGLTRVFIDTSGLPFQQYLGSPIFAGGFVYLAGSRCARKVSGVCTSGSVIVARVPADAAHWQNPGAYRWWNGSSWVPNRTHAVSIIRGAAPVALAYAGDFSAPARHHRFVIITQTSLAGGFTVWQATSLTGTWTGTKGTAPCTSGLALNLCRAYIGHPELSTSSRVMMSFYNPGDHHISAMEVSY